VDTNWTAFGNMLRGGTQFVRCARSLYCGFPHATVEARSPLHEQMRATYKNGCKGSVIHRPFLVILSHLPADVSSRQPDSFATVFIGGALQFDWRLLLQAAGPIHDSANGEQCRDAGPPYCIVDSAGLVLLPRTEAGQVRLLLGLDLFGRENRTEGSPAAHTTGSLLLLQSSALGTLLRELETGIASTSHGLDVESFVRDAFLAM